MKLTTLSKGNTAIETHCWVLSTDEAKAVLAEAKALGEIRPGSYWQNHLARPINVARRGRRDATIYTAGFSTAEFLGFANAAGVRYEEEE